MPGDENLKRSPQLSIRLTHDPGPFGGWLHLPLDNPDGLAAGLILPSRPPEPFGGWLYLPLDNPDGLAADHSPSIPLPHNALSNNPITPRQLASGFPQLKVIE